MDTDKTRKLILALEGVAIITALVLILVDYKLKNDLIDLYRKMERALADGQKILGSEFGSNIDIGGLRAGLLVDNAPTVEAANGTGPTGIVGQNGQAKTARRATPKRSGRVGNPPFSESDKPVGP